MTRKLSFAIISVAVILLIAGGCSAIRYTHDYNDNGITYRLMHMKKPRPNRVHVLRVDLSSPEVRPSVVISEDPDGDGPAEAVLRDPLKLADDPSVIAFINTNPWKRISRYGERKSFQWKEGEAVDIYGLAVSEESLRSQRNSNDATIIFDKEGRAYMGSDSGDLSMHEAVGGFSQILKNGNIIISRKSAVHPRTAIGLERNGMVMWLVVVDGRQIGYSEGMTLNELASLMLDLGCWNATNMDGGGSSIMGIADRVGRMHVVNSPSDRRFGTPTFRPLPIILTIRKQDSPDLPYLSGSPIREQ